MPNYATAGEAVRENYRLQGEKRLLERVLAGLLADHIILNDMPAYLLERVTAILEGQAR